MKNKGYSLFSRPLNHISLLNYRFSHTNIMASHLQGDYCPLCHLCVSGRVALYEHVETIHPQYTFKGFSCPKCKEWIDANQQPIPGTFADAIMRHTRDICYREDDPRNHLTSDNANGKLNCPIIGERRPPTGIWAHDRSRLPPQKWKVGICERMYTSANAIYLHIQDGHGNVELVGWQCPNVGGKMVDGSPCVGIDVRSGSGYPMVYCSVGELFEHTGLCFGRPQNWGDDLWMGMVLVGMVLWEFGNLKCVGRWFRLWWDWCYWDSLNSSMALQFSW